MKLLHFIKAIAVWVPQLAIQLFFIITGLFVNLFAISWGHVRLINDTTKMVEYKGQKRLWGLYRLPKWALAWDNPEDGVLGDDSLRWWLRDSPTLDANDWISRYWWMAIRNPANYIKRIGLGCDLRKYDDIEHIAGVSEYDVRDDPDKTGWQLLRCGPFYHLYIVKRYGKLNRGFILEFGNKIKLSHKNVKYDNEINYYKGFTFELNPFKTID